MSAIETLSPECVIATSLLEEFEREMPVTRKFLERVPEDRLMWRPHGKSMTLGQLALHIAASPAGVVRMAESDEATPPNFDSGPPQPKTVREILDAFDQSVQIVRQIVPGIADDRMNEIFSIVINGRKVTSMPRGVFLRNILLNHTYHHRGQLSVFLRLLGVAVPMAYGPTADEAPF